MVKMDTCYSLSGERVCSFSISVSKGTSHHQKELSFLASGVYFIKADFENRTIAKKFVLLK